MPPVSPTPGFVEFYGGPRDGERHWYPVAAAQLPNQVEVPVTSAPAMHRYRLVSTFEACWFEYLGEVAIKGA